MRRVGVRLLVICSLALPAATGAQEEPRPPSLTIDSVDVEPARPGADTLCRLTVTLRNTGEQTASQLGFKVTINDEDLPVYANQLFMYPVDAGGTAEIQLYNFWSTETSRPMSADGKLKVEVSLQEAEWMDISVDDEGVEEWRPVGEVEGLPGRVSVTLPMARP